MPGTRGSSATWRPGRWTRRTRRRPEGEAAGGPAPRDGTSSLLRDRSRERGQLARHDHPVRRRVEVPAAAALGALDLAVGGEPEVLAGDGDLVGPPDDDVVTLGVLAAVELHGVPEALQGTGGEG